MVWIYASSTDRPREHGLLVPRLQRAQIDDLGLNTVLGECCRNRRRSFDLRLSLIAVLTNLE